MKRNTWLISLTACLLGIMALPSVTLLLIPDNVIKKAVTDVAAAKGFTVQAGSIKTALPFGVTAVQLKVTELTTTLFSMDRLELQLRLLPLLIGRVNLAVSGKVGNGTITGNTLLYPKINSSIHFKNIQLGDIDILQTAANGTIKGIAQLDLSLQSGSVSEIKGDVKLQIGQIQIKGVKVSGMQLPDVTFPELRSLLKIKGQTIMVENMALQGNGVYLRLNGTTSIAAGVPLNLQIELMPSQEFMEQQKMVFMMMGTYQVSPGVYNIPITGTLSSPRLGR